MKLLICLAVASPLALLGCGKPPTAPTNLITATPNAADMTFVQAFVGSCVLNFPDFERVEAAARTLNWKRVTDPDTLRMIGPADGASGWKAWSFKTGRTRFLLSVGERDVDGTQIQFCVLVSEPSDIEATRDYIVQMLRAKPEESRDEGGQRYRVYRFVNEGKPVLLNFIDAVPMGMKMLNTSTMTPPHLQL